MQSPWSVLPLAALMACASASNTREAVRAAEGRYEFIANAPGQLVRGTFRLEGESILLDDGALECGEKQSHGHGVSRVAQYERSDLQRLRCRYAGIRSTKSSPVEVVRRGRGATAATDLRRARCAERAGSLRTKGDGNVRGV